MCAVLARALIALDRKSSHHRSGGGEWSRLCHSLPGTEQNLGIQKLVDLLGDGLQRTIADCVEMLAPGADRYGIHMRPAMNLMKELASGDVNFIMFSDWSKFGLYEADFGWGKPVGVGACNARGRNLDTADE